MKLLLALAVLQSICPFVFAPQEGHVKTVEKQYRDEICINGMWDFQGIDVPSDFVEGSGVAPALPQPVDDGWDNVKIRIPSPWNANSYIEATDGPDDICFPSYPEKWDSVRMAWMRKTVHVPADWDGKSIRLRFDAVAGRSVVLVNGKQVIENVDPFLPFEACLDGVVKPGDDAEILVGVRSESLFDEKGGKTGVRKVPAGSMWGHHISGIWQDVYLEALPEISIEDVFVKPLVSRNSLVIKATVKNSGAKDRKISLEGAVREWLNRAGTTVAEAPVPRWELGKTALSVRSSGVSIAAGETKEVDIVVDVPESALKFWTPETPELYALLLTLKSGKNSIDLKYERFGWREWTIDGNKHCLNGKPYELRGDAWHFQGIPQMSRRYAWAWFRMLKDANCNAVRPHAQIYPEFYLDLADEMGICVLNETGNWGSGANYNFDSPEYWAHSEDQLRRFVLRDRNHASVFGWSVSNEDICIIGAFHSDAWDVLPDLEKAWRQWREIVETTDGTRPWISTDGEDDGSARFYGRSDETTGAMPVTVGHYGDIFEMRKWAAIGKPWGIGEQSMAYYGTALDAYEVIGERAYESVEARMEAIASQCYALISLQRKMGVSYSCIFNVVWYGLQPLPIGLKDTSKKTLDITKDGIFFDDYKEGQPGVQPERLGPWCSTLNPGYDPNLPLYKPWPLFDAVRAANAAGGPAPSDWDKCEIKTNTPAGPDEKFEKIVYVGQAGSSLEQLLTKAGVPLTAISGIKSGDKALCIVDASTDLPENDRGALEEASCNGASIWLWGIKPQSSESFASLLPAKLEFDSLRRSTFLPRQVSWMKGLNNSDFYFCEVQGEDACSYTMKGELVDEGCILMSACKADWRRWNGQPEISKTASFIRSEVSCKEALPVFVKTTAGNSDIFISTIDNFTGTSRGMQIFCKLLTNAGIPCDNTSTYGAQTVNHEDASMTFQLTNHNAFRIFSRLDLRDLLLTPGLPRLDLKLESGIKEVIVNGATRKISEDGLFHDIPLWLGWNDMSLVAPADKIYQVKFICKNKPEYLDHVEISLR